MSVYGPDHHFQGQWLDVGHAFACDLYNNRSVIGTGQETETFKTPTAHASNRSIFSISRSGSDDRGAKLMVLLRYIPLTTKQVYWLQFVTMSAVKLQEF